MRTIWTVSTVSASRITRLLVAAGLAALSLSLIAAEGALASSTWDGRCSIVGVTTFDEPIGAAPTPVTYRDRGTGTCTGTLNGVIVEDTPIRLRARGAGQMGCLGGTSVMPGRIVFTQGTRRKRDDVSHRYVGEGAGVFPNYVSLARGAQSGRSIAYVNMLGRSDPSHANACQNGTLHQASWHAITQTLGPNEG